MDRRRHQDDPGIHLVPEPSAVESAESDFQALAFFTDAILDEGGPMRYATDDFSNGLLQHWRTTVDEEIMKEVLSRYQEILPS